jgi:UDP-N-acetylglucosamine 2-epimerase
MMPRRLQASVVPVARVEGGIRSGDWGMPGEINRLVTDATYSKSDRAFR